MQTRPQSWARALRAPWFRMRPLGPARRRSLWAAQLLLGLWMAASALSGQAPADLPRAPDGRPGLGGELDRAALLRLLRTPDDEQEAFLRELDALGGQVELLAQNTLGLYRSRGYLALLEGEPEESLAQLHRAFREARAALDPWLFREDEAGLALARMLADTRFQVRIELCARTPGEAQELRRGLAVLRASAEGFVELTESEVATLGRRIDLAAASLRALRLDFEALREPMGWPGEGDLQQAVDAWHALRSLGEAERLAGIEAQWQRRAGLALDMRGVLFTAALDERAPGEYAWRERAIELGFGLSLEARDAWPDDERDESALPAHLARLSRTERRRLTRVKGVEGLLHDPLSDALALYAAKASRIVHGTAEALSHYDRFLALRGIRSHDGRTWQERELDEDESEALLYIQSTLRDGGVLGGR